MWATIRRTAIYWMAELTASFVLLAGAAGAVVGNEQVSSDCPKKTPAPEGFRGVFFNSHIDPKLPGYRDKIRTTLHELATEADINLITIFVTIPATLARPQQAPKAGQPLAEWANVAYLDSVAALVDDCHDAGISVGLDLADNRWVPYRVDTEHHVGCPGGRPGSSTRWPVADDTPWDEAATWYSQVINYIEARAKYPESIAMWSMMGNYELGPAEPVLWANERCPEALASTERFVKEVWPVFRAAGRRPKAAPYAFALFSNNDYWKDKSPEQRLSGFTNLKKWLVDDLGLPPDYWPMSTYPYCDPAPDGFYYLQRIVEILGKENASRILSTDLKGPGHDRELNESIISAGGHSGRDMLDWHFQKCAEYGFAGWWIWCYQDGTELGQYMGIRRSDGQWKSDLLEAIKQQKQPPKDTATIPGGGPQ